MVHMESFEESFWYSKLSKADLKKLETCIQIQQEIDGQNDEGTSNTQRQQTGKYQQSQGTGSSNGDGMSEYDALKEENTKPVLREYPVLDKQSDTRSSKAKNKVKMVDGIMDAYENISSSISGKSLGPINYELDQWPEEEDLEDLEDITPKDEK